MRTETVWGTWDPVDLDALTEIMKGCPVRWWVSGGYALEAFVGHPYREHADIDLSVLRPDHLALRSFLGAWDVHCADPPGTLRPWAPGEALAATVHDIWIRADHTDAWRFQAMIDEGGSGWWEYRRDARLRFPRNEVTWKRGEQEFLRPEVQLLYKSKHIRPKDQVDFETCAPLLDAEQRAWLRSALELTRPDCEWLGGL
jgi:hypothetical protein